MVMPTLGEPDLDQQQAWALIETDPLRAAICTALNAWAAFSPWPTDATSARREICVQCLPERLDSDQSLQCGST
jgi:hypothetical protein